MNTLGLINPSVLTTIGGCGQFHLKVVKTAKTRRWLGDHEVVVVFSVIIK